MKVDHFHLTKAFMYTQELWKIPDLDGGENLEKSHTAKKRKGKNVYMSSQTEGRMGKENIAFNYTVSIYCSNLKGNQWLKDKTFHNGN
jgi:hypothetical protein